MCKSRTDKGFYTMTICRADLPPQGLLEGRKNSLLALKAAEFASPAIKTTLTPNTNMDSVPHKHREKKKLLTNTLALGINHMHAQTMRKNTDLAKTLKVGKLPSVFHTSTLNIMIAGEPQSICSLKGKCEHSGFSFFSYYFPKKGSSLSVAAIFCMKLTSCALFCSAQIIFVMIKVRSCKVNDKFSAVEFAFGFSS